MQAEPTGHVGGSLFTRAPIRPVGHLTVANRGRAKATRRCDMGILRKLRLLGLVLLPALALGIAADAQTPRKGGILRVANLGEPPTLDAHWTTATLTEVLTNHLYEGLYALDEGYRPTPMLAEALPTVSPDGLTYAIRLRQGVKFHNGKEMTSDDVVASLKRWMQQSAYGKSIAAVL